MSIMRPLIDAAETLLRSNSVPDQAAATAAFCSIGLEQVIAAAHSGADDPTICARSERNPMLIKLCLAYDRIHDIEIRLNYYYRDSYRHDSWHDHKWNFFSHVLTGRVVHLASAIQADNSDQCLATSHRANDVFYIGNRLFHSFLPEPGTITLMLRGPSLRTSWTRIELASNNATERSSDELAAQHEVFGPAEYRSAAEVIMRALRPPATAPR